jgi:hypothetical protein
MPAAERGRPGQARWLLSMRLRRSIHSRSYALDAFLAKSVAGKLGRYETTMQRQLSALFAELRVMQAPRREGSESLDGSHVLE